MVRSIRLFSPVVCLIALAFLASHVVKADDTAATQPSAANGSIAVTVLDSDGKPVVKARVQLFAKKKVTEGDDAGAAKPKPMARGSTDEDGKFTFSSVASGEYRVAASYRKTGSRGSASVSVTDDASNATVTINLSAPSDNGGGGGATTAPSATPAPSAAPAGQ